MKKVTSPNNIPLVAIATALLWFGWYGFNASSKLDVNATNAQAFLNTDISASVACITWLVIEWTTRRKRPIFIGFMTGAVASLATITPATGFVRLGSAFLIGLLADTGCFLAVKFVKHKERDDAHDVWAVYGKYNYA